MPKKSSRLRQRYFTLPSDLADLAVEALRVGHTIKISSLLVPAQSLEEMVDEAEQDR